MADVIKKATRDGYGEALAEMAAECSRLVVLDADLSKSTKTSSFLKVCPERFIDCGIAEGNMMSIAAGMAASGLVPFASSFAMFATGRAFEQIRNSIGYPHLDVKIGGTHAGISVGEDGATHQCNEDMALMRAIPGMTVICPADFPEAKAAVHAAYAHEGPVYLRFSRFAVPVFSDKAGYRFEIGKGATLRQGDDVTIAATGLMVTEALGAADILEKEGIHARVLNIHTVKPLDEELILSAAAETGAIVTAEEHSIIGGLGAAVCETVCAACPVPVVRVGVNDVYGASGPAGELLKIYGLTAENIAEKAKHALSLKK